MIENPNIFGMVEKKNAEEEKENDKSLPKFEVSNKLPPQRKRSTTSTNLVSKPLPVF